MSRTRWAVGLRRSGPLLVALLCWSPDLAAETPGGGTSTQTVHEVEQLFAEGAALFNKGDYAGALEKFSKAHGLIPEPNLLFNIARCHEAMGQVELAIERYEAFVAHPEAGGESRQDAQQRLARLRQAQAEAAARPRSGRGPAPLDTVTPAAGRSAAGPDRAVVGGTRGYSPWQWVSLGVGAAAAGVGVGMFLMGASDSSQADDWKRTGRKDDGSPVRATEIDDLRDRAAQKKLIGYIAMGAGGAALATGVVLWVLDLKAGRRRDAANKAVAFDLSGGPAGALVGLHGSF